MASALLVAACSSAACSSTPVSQHASARDPAVDEERADVTIRTDAVLVGSQVVVSLRADRTPNVALAPGSLYLAPLRDALVRRRASEVPLVVDVDPTTPFRLLEQVLVTAAQSDRVRCHLRVLGSPQHVIPVLSPRMRPPQSLGLTMTVIAEGISLKGRGGNVAPGCTDLGPGLALPKASGAFDLAGLRACVTKLKELTPDERYVTVVANADVTYRDLLPIVETVRGDAGDLFPEVVVGQRW